MESNQAVTKPKIWKILLIGWLFAYMVVNVVFAIGGTLDLIHEFSQEPLAKAGLIVAN